MNKKLRSFNSPTFLAYALIAPAAIYILLIVAWPVLETIRLSFTNSSLAGEDYVGFENYEKMLSSKKFNKIVTRTFVWMFFSVSLKLIIGLIGAILLNVGPSTLMRGHISGLLSPSGRFERAVLRAPGCL